jgi:glutamate racemase
VKPAALHTQTGVVGVLATAGTFKSQRYAELIARWAKDVRVVERPCSGWVEGIENGEWGMENTELAASFPLPHSPIPIREHVEPLLAENADVLVLGCTHFPFLVPGIEQVIAHWQGTHAGVPTVRLIDPAPAVAQQTLRVWDEQKNLAGPSEYQRGLHHSFYTTGDPAHFSRLASALLGRSVTAAQASIQHNNLGLSS